MSGLHSYPISSTRYTQQAVRPRLLELSSRAFLHYTFLEPLTAEDVTVLLGINALDLANPLC
jgi:hypothetical protein